MSQGAMYARWATALAVLVFAACGKHEAPPPAHTPAPATTDAGAPQTVTNPDLTVEGTAFVLRLPDGKVMRGTELEGAELSLSFDGGPPRPVRLASIKPDPDDPELLRHEFEVKNDAGEWVRFCNPNAYGETWGFPISLPEGHPGREGPINVTCTSGAVGKCARFGYKPWAKAADGTPLLAYHAACVHMVRADYCGDSEAHTKDGTMIDMYDDAGIQKTDSKSDPEFAFEAGWTPTGAACVARTRWQDVATIEQIARECPDLLTGPACTEDAARSKGALIFNRSRPKARIGK